RRNSAPGSNPPFGEAASVAMEKQPNDVGGGCNGSNGRRKKMEDGGYGIGGGWLVA
ncbi:hypothetical protein Dimus_018104, partial [Dionaea muscipula]